MYLTHDSSPLQCMIFLTGSLSQRAGHHRTRGWAEQPKQRREPVDLQTLGRGDPGINTFGHMCGPELTLYPRAIRIPKSLRLHSATSFEPFRQLWHTQCVHFSRRGHGFFSKHYSGSRRCQRGPRLIVRVFPQNQSAHRNRSRTSAQNATLR